MLLRGRGFRRGEGQGDHECGAFTLAAFNANLSAVGVKAERVPYKGGVQIMPDLISGQVHLNFGPIVGGLQHVRAGKLKMLATALPQRSAVLPDVPTFAELGLDQHLSQGRSNGLLSMVGRIKALAAAS